MKKLIIYSLCILLSSSVLAKSKNSNINHDLNLDKKRVSLRDSNTKNETNTNSNALSNPPLQENPSLSWTEKTPLWFFPYEKNGFFVSEQLGSMNLDYNSNTTNFKGSSARFKNNYLHHSFGYAFNFPLFLSLEFHQKINGTINQSYSDAGSYNIDTKYSGLSEPKLSVGGALTNSLFSFGGKLSHTFETESTKSSWDKFDSNTSTAKISSNNTNGGSKLDLGFFTSGGSSTSLESFGSFDLNDVLLDFGFELTSIDKTNSENIFDNYKTKTTYKTSSQRQYYLGTELPNLAHLGTHLRRIEMENSQDVGDNSPRSTLIFNGIDLAAKFKLNSSLTFRPSLYYGVIDSSKTIKRNANDSFTGKITNLNLSFDFSF